MSTYSQNNFKIQHQYRDFYSDVQRTWERIGDVGEESDAFKDRAYKQFHEHDYNKLAEIQDEFIAEDPTAGTPERPNNRNYNRMEYDALERNDGKDADTIKKEVNAKVEMSVDDIKKAFEQQGYTLNSSASAIGSQPIIADDYNDQIKM
jgi:hypothetical protein